MGWLRDLPNGRVQAVYRDPAGRQRSKTFGPKQRRAAREWIAASEQHLAQGKWVDPAAGRRLTGEWVTHYLANKHASPAWHAALDSYNRNHIRPRFGDMPLHAVTHTAVAGWVKDLASGLAPDTVSGIFHLLGGAMDAAVAEGLLHKNPCRGVPMPEPRDFDAIYLSRAQVIKLADTVPARYRALVLMAAWTGMRWGEMAGLQRERVDFLRKTVTVTETLTEVRGHLGVGRAKTRSSHGRVIPLPDHLIPVLAEHYRLYPSDRLVFVGERGAPLRRNFLNRKLRPAAITAKLPPELRFHDLRHTFVAIMLGLGVDIMVISKWLGHRDVRITSGRYARLIADAEKRAIGQVNQAIEDERNAV